VTAGEGCGHSRAVSATNGLGLNEPTSFAPCQALALAAALPHVSECNYCQRCEVVPASDADVPSVRTRALLQNRVRRRAKFRHPRGGTSATNATSPSGAAISLEDVRGNTTWAREPEASYAQLARASGIPGAVVNPHLVQPRMIAPHDHEAKQLLPNCTECTGCTSVLYDMHAGPVVAEGLESLAFTHGKVKRQEGRATVIHA
jgi:hypothetical protein